ncbi:hypothetical protein B0H16DRAFT_1804198 [Mycena metata]|uniref:SNF2 N-terminal domain-containing protein n=1 Tax=Mycena metata TaxID=1033252 RepID=A0AAD7KDC8_9AGAR|nr:hypothetical protein B0H16DRAFT_1804198 [Mycena metata]
MLRRLKKDVLTSLPTKSERILRLEMSALQIHFYKNILSKNFQGLIKSANGNNISLLNLAMELEKPQITPYLFDGAEIRTDSTEDTLKGLGINSGKMVLLDKLLARLKQDGHRVLIFSQMVRMLNIVRDYNEPARSNCNPQSDLQAMARPHRIGQKSHVSVYRFLSKDTMDEDVLERAKKMVLGMPNLDEMDLVDIFNRAEDHETMAVNGDGGTSLGGEGFLAQFAGATERQKLEEDEERKADDLVTGDSRKRTHARGPARDDVRSKEAQSPWSHAQVGSQKAMELKERDVTESKLQHKNKGMIFDVADDTVCNKVLKDNEDQKRKEQGRAGYLPQRRPVVLNASVRTARRRAIADAKIVVIDCRGFGEAILKDPAAYTRPRLGWRAHGARGLGFLDARDGCMFQTNSDRTSAIRGGWCSRRFMVGRRSMPCRLDQSEDAPGCKYQMSRARAANYYFSAGRA